MSFRFELLTPERNVFERDVDQASVPTTEGEITVLTHHIPLVALLAPGIIRILHRGVEEEVAVSGGFIHVQPDGALRVLADTAERGQELNLSVIEAAKSRAEQVMKDVVRADDTAYAAAAAALEREVARYKVARKHHASKGLPLIDATGISSGDNVS